MKQQQGQTFRELFESVAIEEGLTIGRLERRCGLSPGYVHSLFSGRYTAQPRTVHRIAKGLRVEPQVVAAALAASREEAEDDA